MKKIALIAALMFSAAAWAAPMTNDDVIRMVASGAGEGLVIQTIESSEPMFDTSVDAVVRLKHNGVSDIVIQKMMSMRSAAAPQPLPPQGGGAGGNLQPGAAGGAPRGNQPAYYGPPPGACRECGLVEYVREMQRQGQASGAGAVVGGVTGGLVGAGVAGRRDRGAGAIIGTIGGAVVGHQIEKSAATTQYWEIAVRHDDGSVRTYTSDRPPVWRSGDRVRVINGVVGPI